jgi:nitrogen regulatory protein P-II 1
VRIEVLVEDTETDRIIEVIQVAASTDKIGDGKIWSTSIDKLLRVRTGERGSDAI